MGVALYEQALVSCPQVPTLLATAHRQQTDQRGSYPSAGHRLIQETAPSSLASSLRLP